MKHLKKIDLEDKLFHAIKSYRFPYDSQAKKNQVVAKLESIIKDHKILTKADLNSTGKITDFCDANYNKNSISLAKHPKYSYEDKNDPLVDTNEISSFNYYPGCNVSLVLNRNLLLENEVVTGNIRTRLELQVKKVIDLKYLDAIAMPDVKTLRPFFSDDCLLEESIVWFNLCEYEIFLETKALLSKYNLNIPIVSIKDGSMYHQNEAYEEMLCKYKRL